MAHGGRRLGAGRPVGTGSPLNALKTARASDRAKSTSYLRDLVGTDDDPARIALGLAKDPTVDVRLRIDCALGLVPFCHPKLSYTEVNAQHVTVHADASMVLHELEARLDRIGKVTPVIEAEPQSSDSLSADRDANYPEVSRQNGNAEDHVSAPCQQMEA